MIPGLRGSDHLGITVPDIDQAERFFVDVLGAVRSTRSVPNAPTTTG